VTAAPAVPPAAAQRAGSRYLVRQPVSGAGLRLFCFHHAGGTASSFVDWPSALSPGVTILPVQLPGRETRIREPRIRDLAVLVAELNEQIGPALREPYAFYGHSMGALVAYSLARFRFAAGRSVPERLLVGAFPAPHLPSATVPVQSYTDEGLVDWMADLGGLSAELRRYPRWLRAMTELLRDDLALCDGWRPADRIPLPCPIDVFTGVSDPLVSRADAEGWRRHTRAGCDVHPVPGGHFFLHEGGGVFLDLLATVLARGFRRHQRVAL
jgi:surfactin synthase thioesterase subunit